MIALFTESLLVILQITSRGPIPLSLLTNKTAGLILKKVQMVIRAELRDLVTFVQFKKREQHSWRSVTFNKVDLK